MRAAAHNRLAALVLRKTPRYVREPEPPYRHPWFTTAAWNVEASRWEARVRPGFVNGVDPTVPGVEVSEESDGWRVTGGVMSRTATLCDEVAMPLHGFREGLSGISAATRLFFELRGAWEKPADSVAITGEQVAIQMADVSAAPERRRRLAAVDLYLAQARASMSSSTTVVDASGLTGQVAEYSTTFDMTMLALHGSRARLQQAPRYPGNSPEPTLMDRIMGNYHDDGEDRAPVSTVFLLGPDDAGDSGAPDGRWTPYVQHHLFWNVMYASRYVPPAQTPPPIRLNTGLWLADSLGNQMLAPLNDISASIQAAILSRVPTGQFYTI